MTDVVKNWRSDWTAIAFNGTRTLASLAADEWTNLADEINNTTQGKALFADFHIALGSAAFTGADSAIELYLLAPGNADVYPDWTGDGIVDLQEQNVHFVGSFTTSAATAAQELYLRDVEIPPGKWKIGVRSRAPVALNATNTLYYRLWSHGSA